MDHVPKSNQDSSRNTFHWIPFNMAGSSSSIEVPNFQMSPQTNPENGNSSNTLNNENRQGDRTEPNDYPNQLQSQSALQHNQCTDVMVGENTNTQSIVERDMNSVPRTESTATGVDRRPDHQDFSNNFTTKLSFSIYYLLFSSRMNQTNDGVTRFELNMYKPCFAPNNTMPNFIFKKTTYRVTMYHDTPTNINLPLIIRSHQIPNSNPNETTNRTFVMIQCMAPTTTPSHQDSSSNLNAVASTSTNHQVSSSDPNQTINREYRPSLFRTINSPGKPKYSLNLSYLSVVASYSATSGPVLSYTLSISHINTKEINLKIVFPSLNPIASSSATSHQVSSSNLNSGVHPDATSLIVLLSSTNTVNQISSAAESSGPTPPNRRNEDVCEVCSICMERFSLNDEFMRLSCNHLFHIPCIYQWLSTKTSCPVCRTTVCLTEQQSNCIPKSVLMDIIRILTEHIRTKHGEHLIIYNEMIIKGAVGLKQIAATMTCSRHMENKPANETLAIVRAETLRLAILRAASESWIAETWGHTFDKLDNAQLSNNKDFKRIMEFVKFCQKNYSNCT